MFVFSSLLFVNNCRKTVKRGKIRLRKKHPEWCPHALEEARKEEEERERKRKEEENENENENETDEETISDETMGESEGTIEEDRWDKDDDDDDNWFCYGGLTMGKTVRFNLSV